MIRAFEEADTERVMQIWLSGNLEAHTFVPAVYWTSNYEMVKEQIAQSEVYVLEADGKIQGFIGIADGYIAGVFVDGSYRSKGAGKQLLDYAKERYKALTLSVYRENERAAAFYRREGFTVRAEGADEYGNAEYTMAWTKEEGAA